MCGIVGYVGFREAGPVLVGGLKRLEYRGYDSAGVAVVNGAVHVRKKEGKVDALAALLQSDPVKGTVGVGHTRWATHGAPSDANAHPHTDASGRLALVHNGIIENYGPLREALQRKGYAFTSETDTEVLVNLIADVQKETALPLPEAVRQALTRVEGAYGIVVVSEDDPDVLIAARKGSPLILGVGDDEHFVASDASPIVGYTRQVVYLNDGELAVVRRDGYEVVRIDGAPVAKEVHELDWSLEEIEKGGYEHFMLKEIMEQPESLENAMRGRVRPKEGLVKLGGLEDVMEQLRAAERLVICACGTSWHAGLVGEYLIEHFARISVEVEYASEFRYRDPVLTDRDVVLVISQSGETADTLAAVREAKARGLLTIGICNTVGSTIARETDAGVYLHVGPEIGVASTKAFTGQVTVLAMLALLLGRERGTLDEETYLAALRELAEIPDKVRRALGTDAQMKVIARDYRLVQHFLYLGRGPNFPVALEGALKLKEISYVHAEGYPAAEMKHGPIALIDRFMPVVFIATRDPLYEKVISNMEEVAARGGNVIAITDEGNGGELSRLAEYTVEVPSVFDGLEPLVTVIPLQLLAYHVAVMRGANVDMPRNLAKSVTVE